MFIDLYGVFNGFHWCSFILHKINTICKHINETLRNMQIASNLQLRDPHVLFWKKRFDSQGKRCEHYKVQSAKFISESFKHKPYRLLPFSMLWMYSETRFRLQRFFSLRPAAMARNAVLSQTSRVNLYHCRLWRGLVWSWMLTRHVRLLDNGIQPRDEI